MRFVPRSEENGGGMKDLASVDSADWASYAAAVKANHPTQVFSHSSGVWEDITAHADMQPTRLLLLSGCHTSWAPLLINRRTTESMAYLAVSTVGITQCWVD